MEAVKKLLLFVGAALAALAGIAWLAHDEPELAEVRNLRWDWRDDPSLGRVML